LRAIWRRRSWRGRDVAALVVASRALWTPRERRALALTLRGLAWRVEVISDAQAALLGAIGEGPGVLVLAGTGSTVVAHDGRGRSPGRARRSSPPTAATRRALSLSRLRSI